MEVETIVVLLLTSITVATLVWLEVHSRWTARATPSTQPPEVAAAFEPVESRGNKKK